MFDKKIHIKAIMTSTRASLYLPGECVCYRSRGGTCLKKFRLTALGLVFDAAVYFNHLTVKEETHTACFIYYLLWSI